MLNCGMHKHNIIVIESQGNNTQFMSALLLGITVNHHNFIVRDDIDSKLKSKKLKKTA